MSWGGGDQSDRLREVGCLLLSRCSNDGLLGYFPATTRFLSRKSLFGSIVGLEVSPAELLVWPETTWAGRMEGPKLITFLHFFALLLLWEFSGLFLSIGRLPQLNGNARVDRGMCRLQFWHLDLVYNGASWPAEGSKVCLFHLFIASIGCFTMRF